jgi:hypothetical protein
VFCLLALAISLAAAVLNRQQKFLRICVLTACAGFVAINLFQTFYYQTAWRNGETLWQYHIALPHPVTTAYENLAAYYYASRPRPRLARRKWP